MKNISIDIETFSDVDLNKCGVYKYTESDKFEILLFGYSVDGGEVCVTDLAGGETIPDEILKALTDEKVTKWAFNASFERICLSKYLRTNYPQYFKSYNSDDIALKRYLNPSSWKCTMVWSAYMGLPLSLKAVGEVNHPAIIDAGTFGRVQEELARRASKNKVKQKGTKTEQGRYSSKYALTELLVCGECKTPYRRCTWTKNGTKKIVWRCINRLDYGKKYCHNSPSVEESALQSAIMNAIMDTAMKNKDIMKILKLHIGMVLNKNDTIDNSLDIQMRIAEIDAEFTEMLKAISAETAENFDENRVKELMDEKSELQQRLCEIALEKEKHETMQLRLDDMYLILDGLKNHPINYDDSIVRQLLECVVVESKNKIKVVFKDGYEVEQEM